MTDRKEGSDEGLQLEKRRARWRRNKRDERARKAPLPRDPLPAEVVERIWAERDRRFAKRMWIVYYYHPYNRGGRGTFEFQCDVWAARTELTYQLGLVTVSSGKIARLLRERGLTHGYADRSLKTMIWRALRAIDDLEMVVHGLGRPEQIFEPRWPPFDPRRKSLP